MDGHQSHINNETKLEAKKNSTPVVIGGIALLSLLLAVTLIYKNVSDKSAYQSSSRAQSAEEIAANTQVQAMDTSDSYIDQEIKAVENELSLFDLELNEVERDLNVQPEDLNEESDDPGAVATDTEVDANHREGRNAAIRRGQGRTKHVRLTAFQKLQKKTLQTIDRRIKEYNRLKLLLSKVTAITPEQNTTLLAQIDKEIATLTALKTEVKAAKKITELRTHVKSLKNTYKAFALYVPKVHIIVKADRLLTIVKQSESLVAVFELLIKEAESKGEDVSGAKVLLAQMRVYLTSVKDKANQALAYVMPLTPEGYPANKSELSKARTLLRSGHLEMKTRHPRHPNLVRELLKLIVLVPLPSHAFPTLTPFPTVGASPSVSPTTEPSPTSSATPTP